jgi:DNA repair photolyase
MIRHHKGRGSSFNTPNRFQKHHLEPIAIDVEYDDNAPSLQTVFYKDTSRTILAKNDSPDIPFTYSINPYRGCEHGCIYCYARPSHEYLGFSAGLDFESKIMVKMDAPRLLAQTLAKKGWKRQMVAISGNTDCYQPVERKLQLTRQCLEVFLRCRNPIGIVTKNALVVRDIDVLREMAKLDLAHVMISITSLDADLIRIMEPRTSTPANRLRTIEQLAENGIPVGVNASPIIPGLTDEEIPSILKSASEHGATTAGCTLVRLPGPVEPLFLDWLKRELPNRAGKIINRIKDTRQGELNDSRFGTRMGGEGEMAKAINTLFELHAQKYNLATQWSCLPDAPVPGNHKHQMDLFNT